MCNFMPSCPMHVCMPTVLADKHLQYCHYIQRHTTRLRCEETRPLSVLSLSLSVNIYIYVCVWDLRYLFHSTILSSYTWTSQKYSTKQYKTQIQSLQDEHIYVLTSSRFLQRPGSSKKTNRRHTKCIHYVTGSPGQLGVQGPIWLPSPACPQSHKVWRLERAPDVCSTNFSYILLVRKIGGWFLPGMIEVTQIDRLYWLYVHFWGMYNQVWNGNMPGKCRSISILQRDK